MILLSNDKRQSPHTHNIDQSQTDYAMRRKSDSNDYVLYDSIYVTF